MKKLTAVVLGYGGRGTDYTKYVIDHPDQIEVVAVAEPNDSRRENAKNRHNLPDSALFTDWKQITDLPKMADFAIISTQDNMHIGPALACIEKGYDLLLEKPMAPTAKECKMIAEAAEKKGVKVIVCHVLRFTPFFCTIKDIIDEGTIGDIVSIMHAENVGNVHQSHSFVRGNWRNSKESSPMILQKSCHDLDILQWLIGKECKKVQSFGSLTYFTKENQPKGAPDRCTDGCPHAEECPYNAIKLYYDDKKNDWFRTTATEKVTPTDEDVWEALKTGKYGRCVYACDNDVVDHQVVNMEFEGGETVSFTMNAFNYGGRFIRIYGTMGEIVGDIDSGSINVFTFKDRKFTDYDINAKGNSITAGHGGGDTGIMVDLYKYFNNETPSKSICSIRTSYMNHIAAFAAETSRFTDTVIDMDKYSDEL